MKPRIWPANVFASIRSWHCNRRMSRLANSVAHEVYAELWACTRRKLTDSAAADTELAEYTRVRAAQLIHRQN